MHVDNLTDFLTDAFPYSGGVQRNDYENKRHGGWKNYNFSLVACTDVPAAETAGNIVYVRLRVKLIEIFGPRDALVE